MEDLQFFDRKQEHTIAWKKLPHWSQAGTICFIAWRTADSLPAAVIARLAAERRQLLQAFGLNVNGEWRNDLAKLPRVERQMIQWSLFAAWDEELDRGAGACLLRRPDLSLIVEKSLHHFDGDRYILTDFVVMPNQVHLLVAFHDEDMLLKQCRSWKRFTARRIQRATACRGELWQVEQFDHLVRSPDDFARYRRYIGDNPKKANLPPGSYRYYCKDLS